MRPILIVGGAPRVAVDAIRALVVRATGTTAVALRARLAAAGRGCDLLLSAEAAPDAPAARYADRGSLEAALRGWIAAHPDGAVVMSAAVNDYRVGRVERVVGGVATVQAPGGKIASGADEVVIRLVPADKLIDRLRPEFGLRGPLVGFKYEEGDTVVASAQALRARTGAALVVANSLDGTVQALVADAVERFPARDALLDALTTRIAVL